MSLKERLVSDNVYGLSKARAKDNENGSWDLEIAFFDEELVSINIIEEDDKETVWMDGLLVKKQFLDDWLCRLIKMKREEIAS